MPLPPGASVHLRLVPPKDVAWRITDCGIRPQTSACRKFIHGRRLVPSIVGKARQAPFRDCLKSRTPPQSQVVRRHHSSSPMRFRGRALVGHTEGIIVRTGDADDADPRADDVRQTLASGLPRVATRSWRACRRTGSMGGLARTSGPGPTTVTQSSSQPARRRAQRSSDHTSPLPGSSGRPGSPRIPSTPAPLLPTGALVATDEDDGRRAVAGDVGTRRVERRGADPCDAGTPR